VTLTILPRETRTVGVHQIIEAVSLAAAILPDGTVHA
jgi:hypothetical protein